MGSSNSHPEAPKKHFTQVNPRVLANNISNQIPQRSTRSSTATRVPNYVYQVPRDEDIRIFPRANNSVTASGSTNTQLTSENTSSASSNVSTTVTTPANITTPKPLVSLASDSTSSMNSKFENLNLNKSNASSPVESLGTSQNTMNSDRGNITSKENLNYSGNQDSSEEKSNAFQRKRNRNPNGDFQARARSQYNNDSRPRNRNQSRPRDNMNQNDISNGDSQGRPRSQYNNQNDSRPRNRNRSRPRNNMNSNDFEETRGNRNDRPNESSNRRPRPNRPRNPRNISSDDTPPTENSGDAKTAQVHNSFMKKLIGTFPPNYERCRGLFCAACNHYEIFIGRRPGVKHIDTPRHKAAISNNSRVKSMSCTSCRVILQCDIQFLVAHKQSEIHMFIADQKQRSTGASANASAAEPSPKGDNTLMLKEHIKEHFQRRLDLPPEVNDYSFYCHVCEQWFTDHLIWDEHLKKQHDASDNRVMNMTFRHCQPCKLMMCGSKLLSIFHSDANEHEKFKTFLSIPSASGGDDDDDDDDDDEEGEDASDNVSTTSSAAPQEQQSQRPVCLVLKNLPSNTSERDIFNYFKDFGHLEKWLMNPIGENTAVVQFRFSSVAENIINSKFPLVMHGSRFDACLQYL
ncbi:uncharacterized protein LOC111048361 isoform X2 [Nilaparvata lugens]|uniref:uncharacterized protein LOC111048361 isoform X2 n=1 Tax=Nilaparvata lugens TaxID=108931 RepID=UPI00193E3FF4|nr:uncharacterized protein LOC111048361 isoform X2 [Nilaparvata lugens]